MKNSQPSQARAIFRRGQVIVNWLAVVATVAVAIVGVVEAIDARPHDLGVSNLFLGGSAFLVVCAVVAVAFIPAWNLQPQTVDVGFGQADSAPRDDQPVRERSRTRREVLLISLGGSGS